MVSDKFRNTQKELSHLVITLRAKADNQRALLSRTIPRLERACAAAAEGREAHTRWYRCRVYLAQPSTASLVLGGAAEVQITLHLSSGQHSGCEVAPCPEGSPRLTSSRKNASLARAAQRARVFLEALHGRA